MTDIQTKGSPEPLSKALFKDYMMLSKFRLSTTVVGTTMIAYFLANHMTGMEFQIGKFFGLLIGGLFVVASANGFNQIYERETDRLMTRTQNRPVADGRMSVNDAVVFCSIMAVSGLFILLFFVNRSAAFLSLVSIFIYTLAYTPMKVKTPFAVFVGAIPGALPPSIGWVAVTGNIDTDPMVYVLFVIQLLWQFPHFWSIAWILEDDYRKANYTLLPNYNGRSKDNAFKITIYSLVLVFISIYPILMGVGSYYSLILIIPIGLFLILKSIKLQKDLSVASAKKLMFATLLYMPLVLISYFL